MNFIILLSRLIILTVGCIPTVPSSHPIVSSTYYEETTTPTAPTSTTPESTTCPTTTFFSSTTVPSTPSTTTIPTTSTTTTVPTTTPLGCCGYPLGVTSINSGDPSGPMWNTWANCSNVFIQCQITNPLNGTFVLVSIVGNYSASFTPFDFQNNAVVFSTATASETINATVECDRNLKLWHVNNSSRYFSSFDCFIQYSNGSYLPSG
ncbi:hypothetical protein CRE_12261 [Caenorhabditis remanei]|uniref:C6 domain-containing protein n=1 Tax=Caenorhabditis remanei TaxID=31234 RepID=E3N714_CAERE|nr:hypothetical protein CRE_12261 [Caenorhabditis remanei]